MRPRSPGGRWGLGLGLGSLGAAAACGRPSSVLDPQGPRAEDAATLWWLMLGLAAPVVALVAGLVVVSALRGDRRRPPPGQARRRSLAWIVGGGVVLPVAVVVPLSVVTLFALQRVQAPADDDALVVEVIGHRFWWEVRYPDGPAVTANEVHVPVGRDVVVELTSADVIHSFWVPALGGKQDLIPGQPTRAVYRADRAGVLEGVCAEFCGVQHTWMRLRVVAEPEEAFQRWLARQSADAVEPEGPLEELGRATFLEVGCASCHRIRGTAADGRVGPDLTHVGDRATLASATIPNTAGHLGGWISNPHGVKPGSTMPPTPLTGTQLVALVEYLGSLR